MWFTENSWPPILVAATMATILACLWHQRRRGVLLLFAALLLAACPVIWFVERKIITESEKIEANVYEMVDACVRGEVDEVLGLIAANAVVPRELATKGLSLVDVDDDARVTDLEVRVLSGGTQATSRFRCNATITVRVMQHRARHPSHWLLNWRMVSGKWKVTDIRRLDVVTGEEMRDALDHRE